jgi:Serine dehydrogenase proteinase
VSTERTSSDPHLLARVLDDARQADEQTQSAFAANREQIILRNEDLFTRYSELSGGRRLVAYFAKIEHPNAAMQPSDVAPITALLEREEKTKDLDLWINSPGGSAQTAEKIVSACRAVCDGEFRVVVPNMAKSAATMTALCADQIVMGYLSELGPIDPQVPIRVGGMVRYVSAQSFLDGQKSALAAVAAAQAKKEPVIGHLQLLNSPDMSAAWIAEMEREIKFGKDMVSKRLVKHMLPRLLKDADSKALGQQAARIARDLSQANKRFSHGRMIGAEECRDDLKLDVEVLIQDDGRWRLIWEIWVRMEIFLQTFPAESETFGPAKIFADRDAVQLSG